MCFPPYLLIGCLGGSQGTGTQPVQHVPPSTAEKWKFSPGDVHSMKHNKFTGCVATPGHLATVSEAKTALLLGDQY